MLNFCGFRYDRSVAYSFGMMLQTFKSWKFPSTELRDWQWVVSGLKMPGRLSIVMLVRKFSETKKWGDIVPKRGVCMVFIRYWNSKQQTLKKRLFQLMKQPPNLSNLILTDQRILKNESPSSWLFAVLLYWVVFKNAFIEIARLTIVSNICSGGIILFIYCFHNYLLTLWTYFSFCHDLLFYDQGR